MPDKNQKSAAFNLKKNPNRWYPPPDSSQTFFFGNSLISMQFLDYGGVLADNKKIKKVLLSEAIKLAQKLKVNTLELHHINSLTCLNDKHHQPAKLTFYTQSHKVNSCFRCRTTLKPL